MNQVYSAEHSSVEDNMIARASHDHILYNLDGRDVFDCMERVTRGNSIFSGTITTYRNHIDERGTWRMKVSMQVEMFGKL